MTIAADDEFTSGAKPSELPPALRPAVYLDDNNRYRVLNPATGRHEGFQRTTNFISIIEETYQLEQWRKRQVVRGMAMRPGLLTQAQAIRDHDTREGKKQLVELAEEAMKASGSFDKRDAGTAWHTIVERFLKTGEVPPGVDEDLINALARAMEPLTFHHIEAFVVFDAAGVAGKADGIVSHRDYPGKKYIADLKGLAVGTPIATPTGWTTMGEIQVGDQVFDIDGRVCRVTAKSERKQIPSYIVSFDDTSAIVCDEEHLWFTTGSGAPGSPGPKVRTIAEIKNTFINAYSKQREHRIPTSRPLDLPEIELPMDPYLLGCWLGDGQENRPIISKQDDLFDILESDGVQLGVRQQDRRNDVVTCTILGMRPVLDDLGVLGNKHIPTLYLRSSKAQRLRLLQGLMDTDGTWNKPRKRAVFNSTDKSLAEQVYELLMTLGQRAKLDEVTMTGFGKRVTCYAVGFKPSGLNPFRLPRKIAALESTGVGSTTNTQRRLIASIEPAPDGVVTQCISVDSPTHTYLAGHSMIATHNTGNMAFAGSKVAQQLKLYAEAKLVDEQTGERIDHGADPEFAIVIDFDEWKKTCTLRWVDIGSAMPGLRLNWQVREWRKQKDFWVSPPRLDGD